MFLHRFICCFHGSTIITLSPRYEVRVASTTFLGLARGTKAAAQQSAAEAALRALAERPEVVPQDRMGEVVEKCREKW